MRLNSKPQIRSLDCRSVNRNGSKHYFLPDLPGVVGGQKGGHYGGPLALLIAVCFRPASGVKAPRKWARGLALTPLLPAGEVYPEWIQMVPPEWSLFNRH